MDKQAFKQRMQNLKSYRENNPGKGYWDWKVASYADGGEVGDEERQYISDWYSKRRQYANSKVPAINKQLDSIDYYTKSSKYRKGVYDTPITISDSKIKQASNEDNKGGYGGYYHPNEGVVLPTDYRQWKDREPLLHELNHVVNTFNTPIFNQVNSILKGKKIIDRGDVINTYLTTPSEVQSRLMEFRKLNNLDPTKVYGIPDIREWRRTGKDANLLDTFDDNTILELINTVASTNNSKVQRVEDGGQTGDPDKERFYQATGRSRSGRPLEEGLKPVFDLEDAANMTPIGDAISARDTYNAVKERDWLGAGLAALTVLPFVPSGLRNVKAAARYIPTVNRTEQGLINQALSNISKKRDYLSDIANSRNRVLEDINTIPYRNRAEQADKIFGTNYNETYDLLDNLYQHRYFDLPEVQPKDMVASGKLQAKPFAEERFNKTGIGAEPNEFDLWINTGMYRDPMQLANHEMNHYTDYIISRNANTSINNNMLKQLENSLKQTDATSYYKKGTEQKAYMNQLRTMLKQNGDIQDLDEPVSSALLKKYLDKMPDSDPIKKMFKQHKNINAYTKWFNTIPLLGTTALGANAYFNNNKNE